MNNYNDDQKHPAGDGQGADRPGGGAPSQGSPPSGGQDGKEGQPADEPKS